MDGGLWHDFQCNDDMLAFLSRSEPKKAYICQYTTAKGDDAHRTDIEGDVLQGGEPDQQDGDQKKGDQQDGDQPDRDQQDGDQQDGVQ